MESYSFEHVNFTYPEGERKALRDISFRVRQGEFLILCGPSGCGKSTLLRHLKSCLTPHGHFSGEIRYRGTPLAELPHRQQAQEIGFVLQSPENQVVTDKVWHELAFGLESLGYDTPTIRRRVAEIAAFFGIENWFYKDVTELSGGQKQLLSLASVMAMQPGVLLLDEPTKGFDAEFKATFALILRRLLAQGVSILMVSHDVPFCAEHAHRCGLFFDGSIVAEGTPREFFSGNSFYTTPANRMARHLIPEAVTVADIIGCCGGELPPQPEIPMERPLPPPKESAVNFKPKPLPLWRKALAAASLALALLVFFYATGITDLSALISANGISAAGELQLRLYLVLMAALATFIAAIGRRSAAPILQQTPRRQRKLPKRTVTAAVLIVLCIPLTIFAGVSLGGETGFLVGAVTMLASNVLFSQGPWTPWQMFAMGIIGFLAGILFRKGLLRRSRGSLAAFGAFAAVVIYGGIMNPASALMYSAQSLNAEILGGYRDLPPPCSRAHAGKTGPDQGEIRAGGMSLPAVGS